MATALNVFKTVTSNLITSANVIYTAPALRTTIILSLQVTNISGSTANTTIYHSTAGNQYVELCNNFEIPVNDSASILGG